METTVAGIRIRVEPRLDAETIGTLPLGGTALAVLGPLVVDQYSWYQVRDNSGDPPEYGEGWMAVGTASDPWVTESLGWSGHPTYPYHIYGMASGEYGPFVVADWNHGLWWAAAGDGCSFVGQLVNAAGESAPFAEHADVTNFASGQVDSAFFLERPEFVGNVTVRVDSDCSWSVAVIRFQG